MCQVGEVKHITFRGAGDSRKMTPVPSEDFTSLGQRIKTARLARGYSSQDDLADAVGATSRFIVGHWERDEHVPDRKYAGELSRLLDIPITEFDAARRKTHDGQLAELAAKVNGLAQAQEDQMRKVEDRLTALEQMLGE
jgi:ribosome-binding protein aMBF1 (putative translation factor)